MWGVIIGDILGSSFENENHRSPFFELFCKGSRFTDDTVCTAAVASILENQYGKEFTFESTSNELRIWCCSYLNRGFGSMFYQWIGNGVNHPYNSYGNGALMRISPVAKYAVKNNLPKNEALDIAQKLTNITHNHPQALNAVNTYISILFDLLNYEKLNGVKMPIEKAKILIVDTLDLYQIEQPKAIIKYRLNSEFDLTCNYSLGVACAGILETDNFEDCMRQVISAGGDSDTYAAIAGAMAETMYGIPTDWLDKIKPFFRSYDTDLLEAVEKLYY